MTDFETHPAGTAARIGAYLYRRRKSAQTDYENIHSYDAGCATEAMLLASDLEAVLSALTRANAATAAAYEVAAATIEVIVSDAQKEVGSIKLSKVDAAVVEMLNGIAAAIRALATPDQTAALDKLIAEAKARVWAEAEQVARATATCILPSGHFLSERCGDAILAASKKGGV